MPNKITNIRPNSDEAFVPSAYRIKSILLTNHAGKTADIQDIITDFRITESIYTPFLTASFSIKDTVNFIEEYQLSGYEKITVSLSRTELGIKKGISVEFYVVEYPLYGRGQQNTQVYKISAITKHGYLSKLKSISRAVKGPVTSALKRIYTDDLGVSELKIAGSVISTFNGIIPYMNPIDASAFLLRRSFDSKNAPCFLYQTLDGSVHLSGYSTMVSAGIYDTYKVAQLYTEKPQTTAEYLERKKRIISLSSDFRMSKIIPAATGTYASEVSFLDITTKKYITEKFDYTKNRPVSVNPSVSQLSEKNSLKLEKYTEAAKHYVPTSSLAWSTNIRSYNEVMAGRWGIANAVMNAMDSTAHDIRLHGDFTFNVGRMISIQVPKSIDPTESDDKNPSDKLISGKYLVTSVIHDFSDEYYMNVRIKRDSSPVPYTS